MKNAIHTVSGRLQILIDDQQVECEEGASVASVLLAHDHYAFSSHPVDQSPRGPFCMMGACQACRLRIDGRWQQACQVVVVSGLRVQLSDLDTSVLTSDGSGA